MEDGAIGRGLTLSRSQIDLFAQHYERMVRWNKVHNLTRIVEPQAAAERHYLDSAHGFFLLAGAGVQVSKAVDVGTGAGFPGFVGLVLWPTCAWTLLDNSSKRCSFLRLLLGELGLKANVLEAEASRVSQRWPLVVSRATFSAEHRALASGLATPNGRVALWVSEASTVPGAEILVGGGAFEPPTRIALL